MTEGRKRTRLQVVPEIGDEDIIFEVAEEGPFAIGSAPESLICGRCERTLFLGFSRESLVATVLAMPRHPKARTAAAKRPFPFVIVCDCGAINRCWPIIPR